MSDEADLTLDEKRVYADKGGAVTAYVASEIGVVTVRVSDDLIGEFGVEHRCEARDVAAADGRVAVAAADDVYVAEGGESFAAAGFDLGEAVAVGVHEGAVFAAAADGTVAREDGDRWRPLGTAGEVRAVDGPLVAAADGVYRADDGLTNAGLDDARDVAGTGVPLAATATGLYALGNGWMDALGGPFLAVDSDGRRAHAVGDDGVYARDGSGWTAVELPGDAEPVEFAYAPAVTAAITDAGTFLVEAGDGWRSRELGLRDVHGVAIP